MSRVTKAISDEMVAKCEAELKIEGIKGENSRRLRAIISAKKYGISQVSKIWNISRGTLMRWIKKFEQGGSKAFAVARGRGIKPKLNCEQQEQIKNIIAEEGANLTAKKLRIIIEEMFSITMSNSTVVRWMKKLGFSHITPRPLHYKQEKDKQEEFKKKSERNHRKAS